MNIPYLLKVLNTDKLSELVANIDLPPIDMNLAIWDSIDAGEIEIDEAKDRVKVLKDAVPSSDADLTDKILRVIRHYVANNTNITRGRLNSYMKDPMTGVGYPWHEYVTTLQHLIDQGVIVEEITSVPKTKDRPYHKFVFLCLPDQEENAEWNAREINNWISNFKSSKVK